MTPWWRVQAVQVEGCPGLPPGVTQSLQGLVGRFPLAVDPQWIRQQVEVWPGVESVDVRLELPATVKVSATQTVAHGSVPIGVGWQAVAADGSLAGSLPDRYPPVFEGFSNRPHELRSALEVAKRLIAASGGRVEAIRFITPSDLEARILLQSGTTSVVHVRPEGTEGERFWCEAAANGELTTRWADLRWHDRMVVGGGR
jgi:hypothetical protein